MAVIFFPFLSRSLKENKGASVLFKTRSFMVLEFLFLDRFFSIKREAIIFCENCRFGKISLYVFACVPLRLFTDEIN